MITRGNEHRMYDTDQYAKLHAQKEAQKETGKIGLARLPLDRFICQKAGNKVGIITTKPFVLEAEKLEVNAEADSG